MESNILSTERFKYSDTSILSKKQNDNDVENVVNEIKQKIKSIDNDTNGAYLLEIINLIKEFIIEYRVSERTKHHIFDIINTIWNNNIIDPRQSNQFKRCIIGMMVRAVTDIYKIDTLKYNQDHMIIISYLFDKIIHYGGSDDRIYEMNNYLICIESNIDDVFSNGYNYLVGNYNFNYPELSGDVIKLLLCKIIDSYLTPKGNMCKSYQSIVQNIENLLKHINLKNIDNIFNNDIPFDRSLLAEDTENIFDALIPIAKMTVIGSTTAVSLMLQASGEYDALDSLMAIAQRYKNIECFDFLKKTSDRYSRKEYVDNKRQIREDDMKETIDTMEDETNDHYIDIFLACMSIRIHLMNDDVNANACTIL